MTPRKEEYVAYKELAGGKYGCEQVLIADAVGGYAEQERHSLPATSLTS